MACASTTSSVLAVPTSTLAGRNRRTLMKTIVALAEAFQEALDLRRAAYRSYVLSDE